MQTIIPDYKKRKDSSLSKKHSTSLFKDSLVVNLIDNQKVNFINIDDKCFTIDVKDYFEAQKIWLYRHRFVELKISVNHQPYASTIEE